MPSVCSIPYRPLGRMSKAAKVCRSQTQTQVLQPENQLQLSSYSRWTSVRRLRQQATPRRQRRSRPKVGPETIELHQTDDASNTSSIAPVAAKPLTQSKTNRTSGPTDSKVARTIRQASMRAGGLQYCCSSYSRWTLQAPDRGRSREPRRFCCISDRPRPKVSRHPHDQDRRGAAVQAQAARYRIRSTPVPGTRSPTSNVCQGNLHSRPWCLRLRLKNNRNTNKRRNDKNVRRLSRR